MKKKYVTYIGLLICFLFNDVFAQSRFAYETGLISVEQELNKKSAAASNPDKAEHHKWSGGWAFDYISSYTYNADGVLIEDLWQDQLGENIMRVTYTYDTAGRELTFRMEKYEAGQWLDYRIREKKYNSHGNQVWYSFCEWDGSSWDTLSANTSEFIYDGSGFLTEKILRVLNNSSLWEYGSRTVFVPDANGIPVEETFYYWNNTYWAEAEKYTNILWHKYDPAEAGGAFSYILIQEWNGLTCDTVERVTYEYDQPKGFVAIGEKYNSGFWGISYRTTDEYDTQLNFISYKNESWNNSTWKIVYQIAHELTYDADNNLIKRIEKSWSSTTQNLYSHTKHIYSGFPSGVAFDRNNDLSLFPNPAKDHLTLDLSSAKAEKVVVYNQLGQEVCSIDVTDVKMQIDVSGLTPGIYIIKVIGAGEAFTGKFVKE